VVLSLGLCLLVGMLAPVATNLMAGGVDFFGRRLVFDREGNPRIEARAMTYSHKSTSRQVVWYDLDNRQIGTYAEHQAPRLPMGPLIDLNTVLMSTWRGGRRSDLTGWRFLPPPGAEVPIWHHLPYTGLMVGYLYPYGRLIGYMGPEGFMEPDGTKARFLRPRYIGSQPSLSQIWIDGGQIYSIDFDKLTCRRLWKSPDGPIRALGYHWNLGFVLCGNKLRVLEFAGPVLHTRMEAEMPPDLRNHVAWQVGWANDKLVICNFGTSRVIIYHIDKNGRATRQRETGMPTTEGMSRTRKLALTIASAITTPWIGMGIQTLLEYRFPNAYRMIEQWLLWPYQLPFLSISLSLTLASVFLTWLHLRKRSTAFQMVLGLLGTLLLSWPGHLICRTLFELPARVPCPACGRLRAVTRETCSKCHARWPEPAMMGYEIIIPAKA